MPEIDLRPAATTRLAAFWEGFTAPYRGFQYMNRQPRLWRYAVAPICLNIVITGFMLVLFLIGLIVGLPWLHDVWLTKGYAIYWEWLAVFGIVVFLLGLTLGIWKLLEGTLCGYFYGRLAENVENELGIDVDEIRSIPFWYQALDSVFDLSLLVLINTGFLCFHCIPVVGSFLGIGCALYFSACVLGRDYLAFPTGMRGMRRSEIREFCKQHRSHTVGLGAAAMLFMLIPILGAVLLTTAATGAVLLHRRIVVTEA